jgi:hypothetical protein
MGNIWGSEKIRADDRARRRQRPKGRVQKPLEEPLLEAEVEAEPPATPKEHWKVKALRIIHYVAERSRILNGGITIQTGG